MSPSQPSRPSQPWNRGLADTVRSIGPVATPPWRPTVMQNRKMQEDRLRRLAGRQGLKLTKSRRKDPMAPRTRKSLTLFLGSIEIGLSSRFHGSSDSQHPQRQAHHAAEKPRSNMKNAVETRSSFASVVGAAIQNSQIISII